MFEIQPNPGAISFDELNDTISDEKHSLNFISRAPPVCAVPPRDPANPGTAAGMRGGVGE
jgi:hypothetical protein